MFGYFDYISYNTPVMREKGNPLGVGENLDVDDQTQVTREPFYHSRRKIDLPEIFYELFPLVRRHYPLSGKSELSHEEYLKYRRLTRRVRNMPNEDESVDSV